MSEQQISIKDKVKSLYDDNPEEVQKEKDKFSDLYSQIIAKKSARENSFNFLGMIIRK
jgi:hypothetical protein